MESTKIDYDVMLKIFKDYEKKLEKENKYVFIDGEKPNEEVKTTLDEMQNKPFKLYQFNFEGSNKPKNIFQIKLKKMFNTQKLNNISEKVLFD